MSIQVLFRFRDLIANTLAEHGKLIEQHGSCWWGWWKRPHEDPHQAVWDELRQTASPGAPVEIGLFNSGTGRVHLARVIEVIPPSEYGDRVFVPDDQRNLVPDYYRQSPFSRAWLRLSFISLEPVDFFGSYSYESLPQIPNYSESILRSLQGKVIVDAQELRGMDTTVWKVRPRTPGDPSEKVLLTIPTLSKPISREPVEAQSNLVVHISDPHFAVGRNRNVHVWRLESERESGRSSLVEAISGAVGNRRVGLVVVTGDLTFTGLPEEYDEAHKFLVRLAGLWNLDIDRFVVIPGNHDIQWTRSETYDETAEVALAPSQAQQNYRDFYRKLFGHELMPVIAMGRRYALPCGILLEICGVNSSSLEHGRNFLSGMGRIQEQSFEDVARELGWEHPAGLSLRVLALHHHLALTDNLEESSAYYKGFGIAVDAPRIQRMAARRGVHLAIHGHKHRVFIWRSGVYELPEHTQSSWRLGDLSIVGGGSAGSRATEANKNYFNLFEIDGNGLSLEIFRSENAGTFGKIQRWRAGFSLEGGRLMLGDWELFPVSS